MHEHEEYIKEDSILLSVKKLIGIMEDDASFDLDIVMHINAAISVLFQLGVLPSSYTVDSIDDTYQTLLPGSSEEVVNQVKMYLVYKTKLGFDSSTLGSTVIDVLKDMIKEAEWRLMELCGSTKPFE